MPYTKPQIKRVQRFLHLEDDGIYGPLTTAAVKNFQLKHGLLATGHLNEETYEMMFNDEDNGISSDLSETIGFDIHNYFLPPGEYVQGPTSKEYIFIHHTAGWNNPYQVVDIWGRDRRGRVGTQYIIGGINPKTGDDTYDGVILKCFEDENYAFHLGKVDRYMHRHSIGIELCNFGWVTKKQGDYYTYSNTRIDPLHVIDLGFEFRGYRYWQQYSTKQLQSLYTLIDYISKKHNISTDLGLKERMYYMHPTEAFDYFKAAKNGEVKGILSHTSVRPDKYDVSPQWPLREIIQKL